MSTPATVKTHREPLLHTVKHAERSSRQTVALRLAAVALSLVAGGIFIRRIFFRQFLNCRPLLLFILDDADLPKGNDASEIGSVFFRYDLVLVDDAEGCLRAALYSVQFVAVFGTVEV